MDKAKFIGKICPYCKSEFTAEDDIVVCSSCDMPHHKDCWIENQGCTTFGCQGTIKNVDSAASAVTATQMQYDDGHSAQTPNRYCTKCGAPVIPGSAFCTRCGAPVAAPAAPVQAAPTYQQPTYQQPTYQQPTYQQPTYQQPTYQQPTYQQPTYQQPTYQQPIYQQPAAPAGAAYTGYQNGSIPIVDPEVVELIGTNTPYYVDKFNHMKLQGKLASWNWAAFFFGPYWMLYRKMYLYGGIGAGVAFVLSTLSDVGAVLSLAGYIALGVLGNSLYMNHLEGVVVQAKMMPQPQKSTFLAQRKDVNTAAAILTAVGCGLLSSLLGI